MVKVVNKKVSAKLSRKRKSAAKSKQKNGLIVILLLLLSIPLTIVFALHQQNTQQMAQVAASTYPASDGQILWDAGWETGDTSQWSLHTGGSWGDSTAEVATTPVRYGKYSGKLTLNPGSGNVRAEITSSQNSTGGFAGQNWYYSTSVYFPSNPDQAVAWSDWNDFTQWMDMRANCSPPLQYDVMSDNTIALHYELTTQQSGNCGYGTLPTKDYTMGAIVYDQWIDLTAHILWSEDPAVGYVQVWRNGQEVVPLTHMQTLDSGSTGVYMEQAMYRPSPTQQSIIYIDGTRRHTAFVAGSTAQPSGQTSTTPATTPGNISPTFVCAGSMNGICPTPTPLISMGVSNTPSNSPLPSTTTTVPSTTGTLSPTPCVTQTNQSVTAQLEVTRHKHNGGSGSNNSLLQLLLKLLQFFINLLGGSNSGIPDQLNLTPTPSPTPC